MILREQAVKNFQNTHSLPLHTYMQYIVSHVHYGVQGQGCKQEWTMAHFGFFSKLSAFYITAITHISIIVFGVGRGLWSVFYTLFKLHGCTITERDCIIFNFGIVSNKGGLISVGIFLLVPLSKQCVKPLFSIFFFIFINWNVKNIDWVFEDTKVKIVSEIKQPLYSYKDF